MVEQAMKFRQLLGAVSEVHTILKLESQYTEKSSWIALELADKNEDWKTFHDIWQFHPVLFTQHLLNCFILKFNVLEGIGIDYDYMLRNDPNTQFRKALEEIPVWIKKQISNK
jgi:hypothetical protein